MDALASTTRTKSTDRGGGGSIPPWPSVGAVAFVSSVTAAHKVSTVSLATASLSRIALTANAGVPILSKRSDSGERGEN